LRDSATNVDFSIPKEQRDERYADLLSASVKISVHGSSGSGTICYYDEELNWAYVISCGHLWEGDRAYNKNGNGSANVIIWYKNGVKLQEIKSYEAEVLFWSNKRGYDSSLIRFKPDWKPKYFPIAREFKGSKGMILNSLGCDGGKEVARYEVKFLEYNNLDIITEKNSPRPGRSGGGLINDDSELVGICWGTSDITGSGIGFFTPISSIVTVFTANKHEWLLNIEKNSELIPIYDWTNPGRTYEKHFIPSPIFMPL
jgi:hypothetical protein